MCGIIGVYGRPEVTDSEREAVRLGTESMRLRGPDGGGYWEGDGLCFGHRRLAILDPQQGQQPWCDPASGLCLVFNGEIYNFRELRAELVAVGYTFRTDCDTELLLCAYLAWGRACVQRLDGMYAFAIYDPSCDGLWLVRDRLGVKPLYYNFDGQRLRFASTMKALFAFPQIERRMDPAAAWHYLRTIRTTMGRRTLIADIQTLEPGTQLWWQCATQAQPEISAYWNLGDYTSEAASAAVPEFDTACAEAVAKLESAVERQLVCDVPLGGFLSGGVDSSILCGIVSQRHRQAFGTFSVGYDRAGFNEWDSIRESARYNKLENQEIHLRESEYQQDWDWLIGEKGLPLSTPNEVPIYRLARGFAGCYKVALSGEGADEVFGGYVGPTYCAHDWDRVQAADSPQEVEHILRYYGVPELGSRMDHFFRVNGWLSAAQLRSFFKPQWAPAVGADPVDSHYQSLFESYAEHSTFDAYLRVHAKVNLEGLLSRLDTSTMAASVEGRVPYTDHSLVEWLFQLPDTYKMDLRAGVAGLSAAELSSMELGNSGAVESKRLLRGGFSRRVPERILSQPKVSFPVPFTEFFQGEWRGLYDSMLASSGGVADLLRPELRAVLVRQESVDSMLAWPLVNLHLWQQRFNVVV